ncbi:MAG: hypothetical protein ACK2UK_03520 [Candidatus Promineifilaceae bacterium]
MTRSLGLVAAFALSLLSAPAGLTFTLMAQDGLIIDLNGPEMQGTGYAVTFVENDPPLSITSTSLVISGENDNLASATVVLTGNPDGSLETLKVSDDDLAQTNITKRIRYQNNALKLELNGVDSVENYELILRGMTYFNESDAPNTTDRLATFVVSDGASSSEPAVSKIAISAVNDAPILDNSGDMRLETILEDDLVQIGTPVADIIASAEYTGIDRITDPDLHDPEGIAVIEAGTSNGQWQFSIDAGASWSSIGLVSNSSALLLSPSSRIRFLPAHNYSGQATIVFRAWDQTTEQQSGDRADATVNGGISAFSLATESAIIEVLPVEDPPVVDLNGRLPGTNFAAGFLSQGMPIALVAPDAFISDEDSEQIVSLTVLLSNRPNGSDESIIFAQQYAGIVETPYDPETGTIRFSGAASVADYTALLRTLKYVNTASIVTTDMRLFTLSADDGTGDGLVSQSSLTPRLSNSSPVLDPSAAMQFTDIREDDLNPAGDTVASLVASAPTPPISDADVSDAPGFAVTMAENANGSWQYSIDAGEEWIPVGAVSDSNALLLNETAVLRFLPEPDFSGEPRHITVRAWDQSAGANGVAGADVTGGGVSSPFSTAAAPIPITVIPVNDPPLLSFASAAPALFTEDQGPVEIIGQALQLSDKDNEYLNSATVKLTNRILNEPDVLAASVAQSGIVVTFDETAGVLHLDGRARVTEYQDALRAATFNNLSQDPSEVAREISFQAHDGTTASNLVLGRVWVKAVNDPPVLDLNGESNAGVDKLAYYDEDSSGNAPSLMLAVEAQIQDVDNTAIVEGSIELVDRPNGTAETITVRTEGTHISATDANGGAMVQLSGQDTLAAYQQVIRSVMYNNTAIYANRALRTVRFIVRDASGGVATSLATIIVRPQYAVLPIIMQNSETARPEEPNNTCEQALPIAINKEYRFDANDTLDWFSFRLYGSADTIVVLSNFVPVAGQIVVAEGDCGALQRIGQNGDFSPEKQIDLGRIGPGRYYVLVTNDGPLDLATPYLLHISTN